MSNSQNKNEESEVEINFKPSVIIATTHGCVPCNFTIGEYSTTIVPDGMELIKISISNSGNRCMFLSNQLNSYVNMINYYNPILKSEKINNDSYNLLFKILNNQIFKKIKNDQTKILEYAINSNKFKVGIDDEGEYLATGGFKIHILEPGNVIANKLYQRKFGDKNVNDNSIAELGNIEMPINLNGQIKSAGNLFDLFSIKYTNEIYSSDDIQVLSMDEILNHYKSTGTTRLIIFDFTCSVFSDGSNICCNKNIIREIRNINSHIPTGGKKSKKKSKKYLNKKKYKKSTKKYLNKKYKATKNRN